MELSLEDIAGLMHAFFRDNVDDQLFTNKYGEIEADLLAQSTADAFGIGYEDGSLPIWLAVAAERIVKEYQG